MKSQDAPVTRCHITLKKRVSGETRLFMLQSSFRRVLELRFTQSTSRFRPIAYSPSCNLSSNSQSHTISHDKPSNVQQPLARRVFRTHINGLLRSIDTRILAKGLEDVETYIQDKISLSKFNSIYRSTMFNRLICFLLERHLFKIAISVHSRMLHEQFLPKRDISLRMRGLILVKENVVGPDMVAAMKQLFRAQGYTLPMLLELLHFLTTSTNASAEFLDDLADAFVSTLDVNLSASGNLVSLMVTACMRAGRMSAAERWLKKYENDCIEQGTAPDAAPYAGVLETLQEIQPENSAAVQATLYRMRSEGAMPNLSVFNTLIRSKLTRREYDEAFGLYHAIMVNRSTSLLPSDLTFKMLFRASKFLNQRRSRKHKRPANTVPPRRLFRDMVQCHLMRTGNILLAHSNVVSPSCLHLALRTFMALDDYPAAIMTLRGFKLFGFRPNLQTYLIVITSLVLRIKQELGHVRQADEHRFADFVMHMKPREPPNISVLERRIEHGECMVELSSSACVGPETVAHLLGLAEPIAPSRSETAHAGHQRSPTSIIPTVDMLLGATVISPLQAFSLPPLARLLKRALLASLCKKAAGGKREGWDWEVAVVPILTNAKEEMWPEFESGVESLRAVKRKRRRRAGALGRSSSFQASRVRGMVRKHALRRAIR